VRAVAAAASHRVVAAWPGGTVLASSDDGATWLPLGPSLAPAGVVGLAAAADGAVFAAAVAGAEVTVWRLDARGQQWQRWLVDRSATVVPLAALDPRTVFIGLDSRVLHAVRDAAEVRGGERRPMWRATTLGDGSAGVTALIVSPTGNLFAGSSDGVFVSDDGGAHFRRCGEGPAPASILALAYPEQEGLYALTLGGSVWRLGQSAGG
jgi:hypothetical protein